MFARLVTGRYGAATEEEKFAVRAIRTGWLRRAIAAIFARKRS